MPTRVVVAEDEAIIRMDLRELLQEEGYEIVGECGRGDEAVALVVEHSPDVALLDIKMPGLDGISAAREISADHLCAVVLVTAFSQRELIDEATDAGVHGYVVKPFERHDLTPAIEVAIARFRAERELFAQATDATERLETRKLLDRSKGRLMDEHAMTEQAAFDFLQKRAMSTRRPMREIAQDVIDGTLAPDATGSAS